MSISAFRNAKAMRARLRAASIHYRYRGFARQSVDGLRDGKQHLSPASHENRTVPQEALVFSGIQPTGIPHLGNYLGALRPWVELQNSRKSTYRSLFCVVDLHALTSSKNAQHLAQWRKESFASLMAVGLDPNKSLIFIQSDIPAHSELMWILSTAASTGQLSRMTQWKSKLDLPTTASLELADARAKLKLGLFSYPVLQAADILLYQAQQVPVGEDQLQHVEFARDLAGSFNHLYGDCFTLPEAVLSPAKRIMSLKEPQLKMSKSHADPKSRILITDTKEEINTKIKEALTDSEPGITYDPKARPGVSNLLEILKHTTQSSSSCEELANDLSSLTMRQLKEHVSQAVVKCLEGIRESYLDLMLPANHWITDARWMCRDRAASKAGLTLKGVRERIGLSDRLWPGTRKSRQTARIGQPGQGEAQSKRRPPYVQLDENLA